MFSYNTVSQRFFTKTTLDPDVRDISVKIKMSIAFLITLGYSMWKANMSMLMDTV